MYVTKHNAQSGQALLIAILVASVLLTIGLSLTNTTIQETKNCQAARRFIARTRGSRSRY
ncbi:MAG: hypothetical protein UZ22_OP11002000843 [Microgenomates bacterium OLB23]|nr:MAG: hypothetical protein UZ22_OP11002000843 [Microgenomates bacterium OLB23]